MKFLITVSAPSGAGKTTLCKYLREVIPEIKWSISYTTREKRDMETNGIDYYFISKKEFNKLIKQNFFAEWENVHGNLYGTEKSTLEDAILDKNYLLLDMDVKGSATIKRVSPRNTFSIFIVPPSIDTLRNRLIKRGSESFEKVEIRLKRFQKEIKYKDKFDHIMINDDLELAKSELITIIKQLKKGVFNGIKNNTLS